MSFPLHPDDKKTSKQQQSSHLRSTQQTPTIPKYGLLDYVADGVILFKYIRLENVKTVVTAIEILKMRRINHSKEIRPHNITNN